MKESGSPNSKGANHAGRDSSPVARWGAGEWIGVLLLAFALLALPTGIFYSVREDIIQHRRDLRLAEAGRSVSGKVIRSKPTQHGSSPIPGWSEVLVRFEDGSLRRYIIQRHYPSGDTLKMLYLPEEGWCDGAEVVRFRLDQWPFSTNIVLSLLLSTIFAGLMAFGWWQYRKPGNTVSFSCF